ncbi:MAG: AMP-binding protein [Akkermansia sp.]|nr:AMP-binding protein [Akkermansia sp.]
MSPFWQHCADPHAPALVKGPGNAVDYGQLHAAADTFAAALPHRSLVFIRSGNNAETVAAYLGCLRHGHVCLLISRDLGADMLTRLADTYQPDYIYGPGEDGAYRLEKREGSPLPLHPDLAVLLSTSGSTGSPKLVRLTAANLQANAAAIAEYLQLTPQERPVTNLPFYYSYGLSILNSHLLAGAALLLTEESIISPAFWQLCDSCGATSMAGVPYTYDMLEAVGFRRRNMPALRSMTQAGGHMSREMVETYAAWAQERGIRFYVMYGQTEATARMSYLPPHLAAQHPDSIGIAIPGGSFSIDAADGSAEGELVYRGPNVCMGYAETRADLALGDVNGGVLHTGDVAVCGADGLYRITGRLKRFLKIAGNRFSLDELDAHFHRRGIEAVCGGTDGKLLVAITDAAQKAAAAAYLKDTWHLMRTQFKVMVVERIPRSATGKVLYRELFG